MLKELFKDSNYLKKQLDAPLLEEREMYLQRWADKGAAQRSLKRVANFLLRIVQLLKLETTSKKVSMACIEEAAKDWDELQKSPRMRQKYSETGDLRFTWFCIDWLSQIDCLEPLQEEQATFFFHLFERRDSLKRHTCAPLLKERLKYLQYWTDLKASNSLLCEIAAYLLIIMDLLSFHTIRLVNFNEIENAANKWSRNPKVMRRGNNYSNVSKLRFRHRAIEWFRLLGCLVEKQKPEFPFQEYHDCYLKFIEHEQGLAICTIKQRSFWLKAFLIDLRREIVEFKLLNPLVIDRILMSKPERDKLSKRSTQLYASIIRSFLRYAEGQHWCASGMADSIKMSRIYRHDTLPSSPQWADVQKLLADCHTGIPIDIRDYAIILLLSVYGLRSSEVTMLTMNDIDWKAEKIYIRRAKRSHPQIFPLTSTVGTAILRYLKDVRPEPCFINQLFVTQRIPIKALSPQAIYSIVNKKIKPLDLPIKHHGPHALRHACATHLINKGTSLKEIGDHLGHKNLETTRIYTKVDLVNLRKVADQDWEEIL